MVVNPSKTELMSMQDEKIAMWLSSGKLECLSEMKGSGIIFDDRLTCQNHMEKAIATRHSMKPSLHLLNKCLSRPNFKKINKCSLISGFTYIRSDIFHKLGF